MTFSALRKPLLLSAVLSCVLSLIGCESESSQSFTQQVRALLKETGAAYTDLHCYGGWTKREMYCKATIPHSELQKFSDNLGLSQDLPFSKGQRLVRVSDTDVCNSNRRAQLSGNFGHQQWIPTRHGFASSILIYNGSTQNGCLMLSIAYG